MAGGVLRVVVEEAVAVADLGHVQGAVAHHADRQFPAFHVFLYLHLLAEGPARDVDGRRVFVLPADAYAAVGARGRRLAELGRRNSVAPRPPVARGVRFPPAPLTSVRSGTRVVDT